MEIRENVSYCSVILTTYITNDDILIIQDQKKKGTMIVYIIYSSFHDKIECL